MAAYAQRVARVPMLVGVSACNCPHGRTSRRTLADGEHFGPGRARFILRPINHKNPALVNPPENNVRTSSATFLTFYILRPANPSVAPLTRRLSLLRLAAQSPLEAFRQ